ncbi:MAG: hypothetical protein KIY12_05135, partial [Thermoplasmata archaeon]|nr:hypothetical protein [Candidatus Sysuiplasma superficiale]
SGRNSERNRSAQITAVGRDEIAAACDLPARTCRNSGKIGILDYDGTASDAQLVGGEFSARLNKESRTIDAICRQAETICRQEMS